MFMYEKKDFFFLPFLCSFCIGKLSKALWVKENPNNNHPPRIHDVKHILADTSFMPDAEQSLFIDNLQKYQIEGRYPIIKNLSTVIPLYLIRMNY